RMQRLDAPVEHLGKACHLRDVGDGQAGVAEAARGAACGEERDALRVQAAGEVDQSGLVENGEECAADGILVLRCRQLLDLNHYGYGKRITQGGDALQKGSGLDADDAAVDGDPVLCEEPDGLRIDPVLHFQYTCGEGFRRIAGEDGDGLLQDDGAGVVLLVDEVDRRARPAYAVGQDGFVHAAAVHPFATESGQERRVDIKHSPVKSAHDGGWNFLHVPGQHD